MEKVTNNVDAVDYLKRLDKLLGYDNKVLGVYIFDSAYISMCFNKDGTSTNNDELFDVDENYLKKLADRVSEEKGIPNGSWLSNGIEDLIELIRSNDEIMSIHFRNLKIDEPSLDTMILVMCMAGKRESIEVIIKLLDLAGITNKRGFAEYTQEMDPEGLVKESFKELILDSLKEN